MEFLIDILIDCVHDTWAMLPLLLITYCIIEVFERKHTSASDEKIFFGLQRFGPLIGALVGLIPQCGFSVLAAMLFVQRNITLGTLVAVMIATSDEAIPILLSNPELYSTLGFVLIGKFVTGIVVGYLVDFLLRNHQHIIRFEEMEEEDSEEYDAYDDDQSSAAVNGCNCCYPNYPLPLSALLRSLRIFVFLFVTSFIIGLLMEWLGPQTIKNLLLDHSIFQPILSACIGFIPNCAATVVLAQLYAAGTLSLGSLFSGLVTNSGLALLVLIRYGERRKNLARVILILFLTGVVTGIGLTLFI